MPAHDINNHALVIHEEECNSDQPVMISVNDVSMVFNMASEQLNNLKEYALALAKRELRFKEFRALDHISLEVRKGDVFGILGTNGSGKSTLLKIIAGVLDPTEGSVQVNGNIAPLIELGAGFDMDLTARENIYLNGALLGYSKELIEEKFDEIVDFAEIRDFLDIPIKNYSSGMVARIAFAIATVIVPDILLVDEVLSVGDFMFQRKCENKIRQLIEEHGVTVLIVSHSNDQIERLCNRAIWIEKSRCRVMGSAEDVCMIYAGLGGRKGSQESEAIVFRALINDEGSSTSACYKVDGNPYCVAETLATLCLQHNSSQLDTVILASCASHINTVFANTIAKASNALILPLPLSDVPSEILQIIIEMQPKRIIYIDCGQAGIEAFQKLCEFLHDVEIVDLSGTGDVAAYSLSIFQYGLQSNIWSDHQLILMEYEDELVSLTMSPLLYKLSCPAVIARPTAHEDDIAPLLTLAAEHEFQAVNAIGRITKAADVINQCADLETTLFELNDSDQRKQYLSICSAFNKEVQGTTLTIGSLDPSQWMNYAGLGPYLNLAQSTIYPIDPTNLDSIAGCLTYIQGSSNRISKIYVLCGEGALSDADYLMIKNTYSKTHT